MIRRRFIHAVFTDGASRGNPGLGGCGAVLKDAAGNVVKCASEFVGVSVTNNMCEYRGALLGLKLAQDAGVKEIVLKTDSLLLCNQVKGVYRVKSPNLKDIYSNLMTESRNFDSFDVQHIRREFNKEADTLANEGIENRII